MTAPKLVSSAHALEKPPDKRVEREVFLFFASFLRHNKRSIKQHGGRTRRAEVQVTMNFIRKTMYFKTREDGESLLLETLM